jgi:hypothetical protein
MKAVIKRLQKRSDPIAQRMLKGLLKKRRELKTGKVSKPTKRNVDKARQERYLERTKLRKQGVPEDQLPPNIPIPPTA